jgi:hypothetical protein
VKSCQIGKSAEYPSENDMSTGEFGIPQITTLGCMMHTSLLPKTISVFFFPTTTKKQLRHILIVTA